MKQKTYPGNPDCDEKKEKENLQNIDVYLKHFDKGEAPYFYDLLDVIFEETLNNESCEAMTSYATS